MIHPLTLSILYSPDGFISDGIIYVVVCVVCLLALALIIAITICCVCHKKREEWDMTETTDYMGGSPTNGTINSGAAPNGEVIRETTEEQSDFDFDALAESVEMKVYTVDISSTSIFQYTAGISQYTTGIFRYTTSISQYTTSICCIHRHVLRLWKQWRSHQMDHLSHLLDCHHSITNLNSSRTQSQEKTSKNLASIPNVYSSLYV